MRHLERSGSEGHGMGCPTSLTIRRERRGRGRGLRRLLSNLGWSPASVASTRRSSLAWSCWLALMLAHPARGSTPVTSGAPAERGHRRVRPNTNLRRASRICGTKVLGSQPMTTAKDDRGNPRRANVFAHQARAARSVALNHRWLLRAARRLLGLVGRSRYHGLRYLRSSTASTCI